MTERTFFGSAVLRLLHPRIVIGFGDKQRLAVLHHPAGDALAHLHAHAAQRGLVGARDNRVVELLLLFVQHQQRPQLGVDEALHVLNNGAQDRVQVEARGQRARDLVEDEKIV